MRIRQLHDGIYLLLDKIIVYGERVEDFIYVLHFTLVTPDLGK